jgi:hypothetical protein
MNTQGFDRKRRSSISRFCRVIRRQDQENSESLEMLRFNGSSSDLAAANELALTAGIIRYCTDIFILPQVASVGICTQERNNGLTKTKKCTGVTGR